MVCRPKWFARDVILGEPGYNGQSVHGQDRDLWRDFGEFTLTGFAPTAMGGPALFDRIELLQSLDE